MRLFFAGTLVLAAACAETIPSRRTAQEPAQASQPPREAERATDVASVVEPTRFLRQLSLDLRGRPPSFDELDAVARGGKVTDAAIDAILHSDDFLRQVADWHKPLLWPNVDKFALVGKALVAAERTGGHHFDTFSPDPEMLGAAATKHPHATLAAHFEGSLDHVVCDDQIQYPAPSEHGEQPSYTVVGRDERPHRYAYYDAHGVPLPYHDAAHCPNACSSKSEAERGAPSFEPQASMFHDMSEAGAEAAPDDLDPPGKHCPASHPYRALNACDGKADQIFLLRDVFPQLEGYRWTTPYWSRGKRLKTCAREAQTRQVGVTTGEACVAARFDPSCGCGPDGAYCMPSENTSFRYAPSRAEHALRAAINEEPLEIVKSVVARDEDYFETFTTRRSFATGPLAYFFRHQWAAMSAPEVGPSAPPDALPDVPYDDETWHEYGRGQEHAGVLTTTAYLLRFPTWRARVSQFRSEMMCRPFTPVVDSFPGASDECTREPNLAKRCGCRNCHATIEPMGAWFGRWVERGAKYLDPSSFPAFDPACATSGRDASRCSEYVAPASDPEVTRYAGDLLAYLYRSPGDAERIEQGPRGLVEAAVSSGELESCTVTTVWSRLIGRPMSDAEVSSRLPALERDFEAHHRSYRELVRAIAASPEAQRFDDRGRSPRRLDADQLRESLVTTTGFKWIAAHVVSDPDSPKGYSEVPNADMIEVLAGTLGRANYETSTHDQLEPAITFSKLAGDAARAACRASVEADLSQPDAVSRRILRFVSPRDSLASNPTAVRRNLSYLALRFWGRELAPGHAELAPLETLFERASLAPRAAPPDAWRAVCIALATDPKFLTY